MTLPGDYLTYPHRRYGMDQDRYAWRPLPAAPALTWPEGKQVALMIVMPLEFFMLDPSGKPFKHPGAMVTPYPDLRHYTTRDYGNRVGAFRILAALKAAGLTATVPVNAVLLPRIRPLIESLVEDGHEIAASGRDTDSIHWGGIEPAVEEAYVSETRSAFAAAGLSPRCWMSPARQQSFATPDLIRKAGFDVCLDWEMDRLPLAMRTDGGDLWAVPLSNELDDRTLLVTRTQSEDEWSAQILEAVACTQAQVEQVGAGMVGFTLTPYISGQPFRTKPMRDMLKSLGANAALWSAGASAIADAVAVQMAN